jgi:hypothetical protein
MTEASGLTVGSDATSNPLAALKPTVVLMSSERGITILLGADTISTVQRDAAIAYLDEKLSSGTYFRLENSSPGQPYKLAGAVREYTGNPEFRQEILDVVNPAYRWTGTLTMEAVRQNRQMIGMECVVTAANERGPNIAPLTVLTDKPDEVLAIQYDDREVAFTLKDPTRGFAELLDDALRVAKTLSVYVEQKPNRFNDKDRRAGLYDQFAYIERPGA